MADRDQVRPLAPASERPTSSDDEESAAINTKGYLRRKNCIKCCGGISAILIIQAIVVVILIFTVFKVKDPEINLKGVTIDKLDLVNGTTPRPGSNMTLTADLAVKNPNYASFKYGNTTTTLYYHGTVVGEARGPPGKSKARRTARMNITIDFITDRLIGHPMLKVDVGSGLLPMTTFSRVGGRVKMLKIINKHVVVKMNCSVSVNITSRTIQDQKCKRKVKL
ncbi:OLC1v1000227C1 [Oldenlandia corymbosa var. corymbosa]|uniref:OLC1v1000227C1 n=1 Tax=Oldenlandia corymbosa var. corymbosa TaxID=529605 RepID=A0AAV1D4V8_OLDCO|nr:OLC1v1000227C1 [Oldenlandia corymbosa var. corymbosa]